MCREKKLGITHLKQGFLRFAIACAYLEHEYDPVFVHWKPVHVDVTVPQTSLPDGSDLLSLGFAGAPTDLDEGHHSLALLAQPEQVQVWPLTQSFSVSLL